MAQKAPKPDTYYVGKLVQVIRDDFRIRDTKDAEREEMYWQVNPIAHPAHVDFQPIHMGVITEVVQRIRGILDESPRVKIVKTSIDQMALRRQEELEEATNAAFSAFQDDSDIDVWDYIIEDVIRYGRGYDELLYVPQYRSTKNADFPKQAKGESAEDYLKRKKAFDITAKLPIVWRHLPARQTYMWYDEEGPYEAVVVEERRIRDILNHYDIPALRSELVNNPLHALDRVYFVRYYNRDWCAKWVSSQAVPVGSQSIVSASMNLEFSIEIVDIQPNIYGRVPIIETRGITTSDRSAARNQISIFDHMIDICRNLDQIVSQKATAVRQWAWATPFIKTDPRTSRTGGPDIPWAPDTRPEPFEIEAGMVHELLPGQDIGWFIAPGDGAGSNELLKIVQTQADLLGVSSSVFSGEALSANGYLYNSIMNAIRSKYSPITRHVKRSHRQRVQLLYKIMELHGEPLYIYREETAEDEAAWLKLDPRDTSSTKYNIEVLYEDHLPTDDQADVMIALQTTGGENPLLDINTARERYLRDRAPEKTSERVLIQQFMELPPVKELLMARAVRKAGLQLDEQDRGSIQGMQPEAIGQLPPALQAALGIPPAVIAQRQAAAQGIPTGPPIGGPQPTQPVPAMPANSGPMGGALGGPSTGASAVPGVNAPMIPASPQAGRRTQRKVPLVGGRAVGQSKAPRTNPQPYKP